jgi:threonine/homoserine/homoserine lactone efflux protein
MTPVFVSAITAALLAGSPAAFIDGGVRGIDHARRPIEIASGVVLLGSAVHLAWLALILR